MNNKGQFSIIAALLVAVVLVAAVMTTYSAIRYGPVQGQPQILSEVDESNLALKQILGFTVGYYGSVLKVTGNVTYAQQLARKYFDSGLMNVGFMKPEWGLSLSTADLNLSTNWLTDRSYSQGTVQVTYDLNGIGITGISYSTSSRLEIQISNINSLTQAQFKILTDNSEPLINLGTNNLKFYRYNYEDLTWEYSVPTNIISYGDGTYLVDLPEGVPGNSYVVQVDDTRGISVLASSYSQFTAAIAWNPAISSLINLQESTFTLELLQNGTIRWLGQNLQVTTQTLPILPIPVRAIHVNQTLNGVNQEVPFQIEDWASNYQIPQGLTSNTTIFGNRQMIVFLLDSKSTCFTVWWEGSDTATQTPMAFTNRYFNNDNPAASTLSNGKVTLLFGNFDVKSTVVGTTISSTAYFMRLNQEASTYGAGLSYVIHHGIVRDVIQQEAEWSTGADGCPNFYSNMVLTLPANTTYYTYYLRIMFINSSQARSITDLSPIRLTTSLGSPQMQTENGTLASFPIVQNGTGTFVNSSSGSWTAHHFSQFISDSGQGAGIMFTDKDNQNLYSFDSFSGSNSKGALKASSGLIELLPVSSGQVQFNYAYDIAWQGAVVTFDNKTPVFSLYNETTSNGLWILVEYPPILTVTASLPPLTVSVTPTGPLDIGVGQTQLFTATASGGTGAKSYQWYLDGGIVTGQTASTCTYTAALGSHSVYVRVTDSASPPVSVNSNTVSITSQIGWWNTNFHFRSVMTIRNDMGATLSSGYTVHLNADTASLISTGKMQPNGNDLRIVYHVGSSFVELDRNIVGINTNSTQIYFKIQDNIPTNTTEQNYELYYGNPSANNPPENMSNIYLWYDDFNRADKPNITTEQAYSTKTGGGVWSIENNSLKNVGASGDPNKLIITALGQVNAPVDILVKIKVTSFAGGDESRMGLSVCMDSSPSRGSGYCALFHQDTNSLDLLNDLRTWGTHSSFSWSLNTWYNMQFRVLDPISRQGQIKVWQVGTSEPSGWTVNGDFGGGSARNFGEVGFAGSRTSDTTYFDDIVIRYAAISEPTVLLGLEEHL